METSSRQTQCPVSKLLQRYIKELRLTVLLVPPNKVWNMYLNPVDWDVDFAFPNINLALL